jgi:hypothetical protein
MNVSVETERNNVTVEKFLAYVRRRRTEKRIAKDAFGNLRQNHLRSYRVKDGVKRVTEDRKRRDEMTRRTITDLIYSSYAGLSCKIGKEDEIWKRKYTMRQEMYFHWVII